MPVAYRGKDERVERVLINYRTSSLLALVQDAAEEPSTYCFQKALETKRDYFRRDEGGVKSLKGLLKLPGFFFGTVIPFRGYIRKTPLNYPLYALHSRGRFGFCALTCIQAHSPGF